MNRPAATIRAFTLIELLVTMAIIAIIATITVVSVASITRQARLSSAVNTVVASLDNARALAMRRNRIVLVVFRPRIDGTEQYNEVVFAQWTGETFQNPNGSFTRVMDRFEVIPDVSPRQMPPGIKVAGPSYFSLGDGTDNFWTTQVNLRATGSGPPAGERLGDLIAVMYAADGTVITRNPASDSNATFVDFDRDGCQFVDGTAYANNSGATCDDDFDDDPGYAPNDAFNQQFEDEEINCTFAPFLAVYDDDEARERQTLTWTSQGIYDQQLTGPEGFITTNSDRLHFNRYTGVVMR